MTLNYHSSLRSLSSLLKKSQTHFGNSLQQLHKQNIWNKISPGLLFFLETKFAFTGPARHLAVVVRALLMPMDFTIMQVDLKNDLLLILLWGLGTGLCCRLPPWLSGMNLHADCRAFSLHYFPLFFSSFPSSLPNPPARGARERQEVFVFPWVLP